MRPFSSLDEVYNLVLSEESRRNYNNSSFDFVNDSSFMAFQRSRLRNDDLECTYCKKTGHIRDRCFRLVGFPPKQPNSSGPSSASGSRPGSDSRYRRNQGFRGRRTSATNSVYQDNRMDDFEEEGFAVQELNNLLQLRLMELVLRNFSPKMNCINFDLTYTKVLLQNQGLRNWY